MFKTFDCALREQSIYLFKWYKESYYYNYGSLRAYYSIGRPNIAVKNVSHFMFNLQKELQHECALSESVYLLNSSYYCNYSSLIAYIYINSYIKSMMDSVISIKKKVEMVQYSTPVQYTAIFVWKYRKILGILHEDTCLLSARFQNDWC